MSSRWSWVFGILTAAATALGVLFFAATQQVTGRDWIVLGIGGLIGTTCAALVGTFLFHSARRAERTTAIAATEAKIEEVAAAKEQERRDRVAAAEVAVLEKRAALLQLLPSRIERISQLRDEITEIQIDIVSADGSYRSGMLSARDAKSYGYFDIAQEQESAADTWRIAKSGLEEKLSGLELERDRLSTMTDEAYLTELKRQRGLD